MITEILGTAPGAGLPVTDSAVLRGDGCFEVLRSYGGRPFRLDDHLDRLQRSAGLLDITLPAREDVAGWVREASASVGDGAVRVVVTRGPAISGIDGPPRVVVFGHDLAPIGNSVSLWPVPAPWHPAGAEWALRGAKTLSYAPNIAATREARSAGSGDALLLSGDGTVLEGPTFSVGWVADGVIETPGLELGILDSITRRCVLELAAGLELEVREGTWVLSRAEAAAEVFVMSTLREVQPVDRIGPTRLAQGPITAALRDAYRASACDDPRERRDRP